MALQSNAGAVVATTDGNLAIWPKLDEVGSQEPLTAHVAEEVTCLGAYVPAHADLAAVAGTKAGKLLLLHCANIKDQISVPAVSVTELHIVEVTSKLFKQRKL